MQSTVMMDAVVSSSPDPYPSPDPSSSIADSTLAPAPAPSTFANNATPSPYDSSSSFSSFPSRASASRLALIAHGLYALVGILYNISLVNLVFFGPLLLSLPLGTVHLLAMIGSKHYFKIIRKALYWPRYFGSMCIFWYMGHSYSWKKPKTYAFHDLDKYRDTSDLYLDVDASVRKRLNHCVTSLAQFPQLQLRTISYEECDQSHIWLMILQQFHLVRNPITRLISIYFRFIVHYVLIATADVAYIDNTLMAVAVTFRRGHSIQGFQYSSRDEIKHSGLYFFIIFSIVKRAMELEPGSRARYINLFVSSHQGSNAAKAGAGANFITGTPAVEAKGGFGWVPISELHSSISLDMLHEETQRWKQLQHEQMLQEKLQRRAQRVQEKPMIEKQQHKEKRQPKLKQGEQQQQQQAQAQESRTQKPKHRQGQKSKQQASVATPTAPTSVSTKENMENLVKAGEELLKKPVSRMNLENGQFEPAGTFTNEKALIRVAEVLSKEKRLRDVRSPHGKR